jgi:hypothetical protein
MACLMVSTVDSGVERSRCIAAEAADNVTLLLSSSRSRFMTCAASSLLPFTASPLADSKKADHRHRRLLCARRERPSRHASEQRYELAPS